ncbi:MAG: tRNA pseudouridine(55) synthase TruB [Planctomycetes bacterium]|nr:tRNA pseudouridine(55) synthase TruB [Planctomycetota bacterium]
MSSNHAESIAISGVVNLYKPAGRSSAHYVYRLRRVFGIRKVGHAGTLDPFADGVLLACLGRATKLVEKLMELPKHYRTTLRLGVTNETFDPEHPFVDVPVSEPPGESALGACLAGMVGNVMQIPPNFSAIRVGGVQSYVRARKGKSVELAARPVRIDRIDLLHYEWPRATLDIHCGRGTYIRAIARDIGEALKCGACCETLTRMAVGPFKVGDSARLESGDEGVRGALVSVEEVTSRLHRADDAGSAR